MLFGVYSITCILLQSKTPEAFGLVSAASTILTTGTKFRQNEDEEEEDKRCRMEKKGTENNLSGSWFQF